MEAVKKMYLVDERTYNSTKSPWQAAITDKFQEAAWNKPPERRSKTEMHKGMHSLLESDVMSNDVKAKLYNQQLIRFLNTNKGSDMQPVVIKEEPVIDFPSVTAKTSKRKKKKQQRAKTHESILTWEDLPASPDRESELWETDKKKNKKKDKAVRRSSRPKKPIKWDPIYNV